MNNDLHIRQVEEAADFLSREIRLFPRIALVIGSGLGGFLNSIRPIKHIPYSAIPHFPLSTVSGHKGALVLAGVDATALAILDGRKHLYEGVPAQEAAFPIRVLGILGVRILILTNAAGALNPDFLPGDLMLISDHINLMFRNPLIGFHHKDWGVRFPDMSQPYDRELRRTAHNVGLEINIPLREGIYAANLGPNYESRSEVEFLRLIGADAVGMSTAPEDIVARQMGLRVLGLSYISNSLVLEPEAKTTHEEVLENVKLVEKKFSDFVIGLITYLSKEIRKE